MTNFKKLFLLVGDLTLLYLSLVITIYLRYGPSQFKEVFGNHLNPFSWIFPIWIIIFYLADLYRHKTLRNLNVLAKALGIGLSLSLIVSVMIFYAFGGIFEL